MSENRNNLTRKIELLFSQYLRENMEEPPPIFSGHDRAQAEEAFDDDENIPVPHILIYADNSQPHPEMPTSTGVRVVALRIIFRADSTTGEDADRQRLDGWREEVECLMSDISGIAGFINPTAVDTREIIDVHFYDAMPSAEPSENEGTDWLEEMQFDVVCQNGDDAGDRPRNYEKPAISGTAYPGEILTVSPGTWDDPEKVTGTWVKNGTDTEDSSGTYAETLVGDEIYWQELGEGESGDRLVWSNTIKIVAVPEPEDSDSDP